MYIRMRTLPFTFQGVILSTLILDLCSIFELRQGQQFDILPVAAGVYQKSEFGKRRIVPTKV